MYVVAKYFLYFYFCNLEFKVKIYFMYLVNCVRDKIYAWS